MILLYIFTIIFFVAFLLALYVIKNLLSKYEELEDEIEKADDAFLVVYNDIRFAYNRMKKIDRLGSFESDDESGFIFTQIKNSMELLNKRLNLDAKEEKE